MEVNLNWKKKCILMLKTTSEKSGLYYVVMIYTNVRGERKEKWFPTKLSVKGNKTKAEAFSRMVLRGFKIPREDLCFHEVKEDVSIDESQPIEPQLLSAVLDKITLSELSVEQISIYYLQII